MALTKADILQGKDNVQNVYIPELEGEVALRPLTDGQMAQVKVIQSAGIQFRGAPGRAQGLKETKGVGALSELEALQAMGDTLEFDISEVTKNEYEAKCLAVSYALSVNETWTIQDVKNLRPAGVVDVIAKVVFDMTIPKREEVETFREERGGQGDPGPASAGI